MKNVNGVNIIGKIGRDNVIRLPDNYIIYKKGLDELSKRLNSNHKRISRVFLLFNKTNKNKLYSSFYKSQFGTTFFIK